MAYVCLQCGRQIKDIKNFVRCPYCGYRVVAKERSSIAREISTD
ncbi:MAG: DNA-directed RNA polymerase subunit P [Candidatus Micrarchaeota archaeon]